MKSKNYVYIYSYFFILLISIISSIILFCDINRPDYYEYIWVLPINFLLTLFLFNFPYIRFRNSIVFNIVTYGYFLKMVLTPIVMRYGNYSSLAINYDIYFNSNKAIFLLSYEYFFISAIIYLYYKFYPGDIRYNIDEINDIKNISPKSILLLIVMILIASVMCFLYPHMISYFEILLFKDSKQYEYLSSIPGYIFFTTTYLMDIIKFIIPIFIIRKIYNLKCKEDVKLVTSFIIVLIFMTIMSPQKSESIFTGIAQLILLATMYTKGRNLFIKFIKLLIPVVFFMIFIKVGIDFSSSVLISELSNIVQAYFSGVSNIAAALSLHRTDISLDVFIGDILGNFAFLGKIFNVYPNTNEMFNNIFFSYSGRVDQIIPAIGQGYFYFGYILSPILSGIVIVFSLYLEKNYTYQKDIIKRYIYILMFIMIPMIPISYNFTILIYNFTRIYMPIFIIYLVGKNR